MLLNGFPAISYISWKGLIIIDSDENETPYVIQDGKSCKKYVYWDISNPYILRDSDDWIIETSTRKMIYINTMGEGTEVPHDDITIQYRDIGSTSVLGGSLSGKFDEIDGKFVTIKQDVDEIKETIGSSSSTGNSLTERVTKVEKTAEGISETVRSIEKTYDDDKEANELRDNINMSLIDLNKSLSDYEQCIIECSKDLKISDDEKTLISTSQDDLILKLSKLYEYHDALINKLNNNGQENANDIISANKAKTNLTNAINTLNQNVNTCISDNTIVPSEITIMLNMFANASNKINEYKNTISDIAILGIGGKIVENLLSINKTSNGFSQKMSEVIEEIDGETGLKKKVESNATNILQTAKDLELNYTKFDKATSSLKLGDGYIKLDAGRVLMTGTLTWDSLDDVAKENLKGKNGTAEYVMLVGDQIIKYDSFLNPNMQHVILTAMISGIPSTYNIKWSYKNPNSLYWIDLDENNGLTNFTLEHNNSIWNNSDSITIRVTMSDYYDDITIIKVYDGLGGEDARYVKLDSEQLFKYGYELVDKYTLETANINTKFPVCLVGVSNVDNCVVGNEQYVYKWMPNPRSITLKGSKFNIDSNNSRWYYKLPTDSDWTLISQLNGLYEYKIYPNDTVLFNGNSTVSFKFEIDTYSDTTTVAKISDGVRGDDGIKGENGDDGYYVLITNESHTVPCDPNGGYIQAELSKAKTEIHVYKGIEELDFDIKTTDIGCVSSYDKSTKILSIKSLSQNTAMVNILITIDGRIFKKIMTITKSLKGDKGNDGAGLNVIGELTDIKYLPIYGKAGDAYIINGLLYVWQENTKTWSDGVPFKGDQGIPGINGEDGRTTYLHIKYSDDGKTFTMNSSGVVDGETAGNWIGQYTDFYPKDSMNFNDYTWKKIKGEDGDNSIVANLTNDTHSVPTLEDGSNGKYEGCNSKISIYYGADILNYGVSYSYKSSNGMSGSWDSSTGTYSVTSMSTDIGYVDLTATYNGISYTKRFTVTKNKQGESGGDGDDAYTINISNDNHSFVADYNGKIIYNQTTTTTITAYKGTMPMEVTIGTLPIVNGLFISKNGTILTISTDLSTQLTKNGTFNIPLTVDGKQFIKQFSYSRVDCGADGNDGNDGSDAYTIYLTNENHSFPCESNGSIIDISSTTTMVKAFLGEREIIPTIGKINVPNGLEITIESNTLTIKTKVGNDLAKIGSFNIPITIDGRSFIKTFSWSKSMKGEEGEKGDSASYVIVSGEQTFKYTNNFTGNPIPISIVLSVSKFNVTSNGKWQYKKIDGSYGDLGSTSDTISITPTSGTLTTEKYCTFRYMVSTSIYDEITIVKVSDGAKGDNGEDSYTVILTNENHSFPCEANGYILSEISTSSTIIAYKGSKTVSATIGNIVVPKGMSVTKNGSTLTIKALVGIDMDSAGSFNIPITIDGISFTKTFSWSKAFRGNDGVDGDNLEVPDWVKEWDSNATSINGQKILTPKIFAGSVTSGIPTGVAMGKNVFGNGAYTNTNGIVGYKNGIRMYTFDTDGTALIGNPSGNRLSWNGSRFEIVADSISIGSGKVVTDNDVGNLVSTGIKNISIGSNNILLKSNLKYTNGSYPLATYDIGSNKPKDGDEYTVVVKGTLGEGRTQFSIRNSGGDVILADLTSKDINSDGLYVKTFNWKVSSTTNTTIRVYPYPSTATSNSTIEWIKITKGNKSTSDWVQSYEDTSTLIDDAISSLEDDLQKQIDGKIQTWYQSSDPASNWTTTVLKSNHTGDIWYNTTSKLTYRYGGTSWIKLEDADAVNASALASKKAQIFTTTPTVPYYKGDLWITSLTGLGVIKTCSTSRTSGSYTASEWVEGLKYVDDVKAGNIAQEKVDAQTQLSIFNKLTNNGSTQGIYMENNKLYLNGEYMKADSISTNALKIGDFTNYSNLSVDNLMGLFTVEEDISQPSNPWLKMNTLQRDTKISKKYYCNGGENFRIKCNISTSVKASNPTADSTVDYVYCNIGLYGKTASGENFYTTARGIRNSNNSNVSTTTFIPSDAIYFEVFIQLAGWKPFSGDFKIRNLTVTKMSTGEMIVNGSVSAEKINARGLSVVNDNGTETLKVTPSGDVNLDVNSLKIKSSNVATESYVTLNSNKLELKFSQTSGYNMLLNSNPSGSGIEPWAVAEYMMAGADLTRYSNVRNDYWTGFEPALELYIQNMTGGEYRLWQKVDGLGVGEKYILSGYMAGHRSNKCIYIRAESSDEWIITTTKHFGNITGGGNIGEWEYFEIPFVTNRTSCIIDMMIQSTNGDAGYLWAKKLMLNKGDTARPYSPNSNEVYTGIVGIDKNGIKVSHSNGSMSQLSSDCLKFTDENSSAYSKIKDGKFTFTDPYGNPIGWQGRQRWQGSESYFSSLNAEYGSSIAFGCKESSDANVYSTYFASASCAQQVTSGWYLYKGLNMNYPYIGGILSMRSTSASYEDYLAQIINHSGGALGLYGDNIVGLGVMEGTTRRLTFKLTEDTWNVNKAHADCYTPLDMHNFPITNTYSLEELAPQSLYSRMLYDSKALMNSYGVMSLTNGDIRFASSEIMQTTKNYEYDKNNNYVWDGTYTCYCEFPIYFAENIENEYNVNISKNSYGDYKIKEKNPYYFIIESKDEHFSFTFEIVARKIEKNDNIAIIANESIDRNLPVDDSIPTYKAD